MSDFDDDGPAPEEGNDQAWMATFADLSTLLLTFFVLLLSFANMDVVQFREMLGSLKEAFGYQTVNFGNFNPPDLSVNKDSSESLSKSDVGEPGDAKGEDDDKPDKKSSGEDSDDPSANPDAPVTPEDIKLIQEVQQLAAKNNLQNKVQTVVTNRGVVIRVREQVVFTRGTNDIVDQAYTFLNEIAALLRRFDYDVTVEGHTDDRPLRSRRFKSNWELSSGRAIAVMRYLAEVGGIDPRRMGAAGYGGMRPIQSNQTRLGRQANRRVEFLCHRHPALSRSKKMNSGVIPTSGN